MTENPSIYKTLLQFGLSKSYASQLASGARQPGLKKAIEIFQATGLKLGPLKGATAKEIDAAARIVSSPTDEAA